MSARTKYVLQRYNHRDRSTETRHFIVPGKFSSHVYFENPDNDKDNCAMQLWTARGWWKNFIDNGFTLSLVCDA